MAEIGFWDRVKMAWRILISAEFARDLLKQTKTTLPPERVHASGLMLLAALQREGRLVDFLQQDAARFSDQHIHQIWRERHGRTRRPHAERDGIAPNASALDFD